MPAAGGESSLAPGRGWPVFTSIRCLPVLVLFGLLGGCSDRPAPQADGEEPQDGAPVSEPAAPLPASVSVTALPESFEPLWEPWKGDFDGMVERRFIRALVVYGGFYYYFESGRPKGITHEFLRTFERYINKQLGNRVLKVHVVEIPVTRDRLIPELLAGHGDLAVAGLTITEERLQQVDFSLPFGSGLTEIIVKGPAAEPLERLEDLAGRQVYTRRSSSYFASLESLNREFAERGLPAIEVVEVSELLEDHDVLAMLDAGLIPLTAMDDYKAEFWSQAFENVTPRKDLVIRQDGKLAWAFRKDSPGFAEVINGFMRKHRRGTLVGNVLIERYLSDAKKIRELVAGPAQTEKLRPLVALFQKYAEQYGFDWLQLAAMAMAESGLDHGKRSSAGAIGIMQVRPSTAADNNVDVGDVTDLETNIHAGAKYLRFLEDRYFSDPKIDPLDRWLFAFAAYNAGPAKIQKLRRLTAKQQLDPNVWFQNVEVVAARMIGRETVEYVGNILKYYVAYKLVAERNQQKARGNDSATAGGNGL